VIVIKSYISYLQLNIDGVNECSNRINQYIGTQTLIECDCRGIFRLPENKRWENGECELYIWYIVIFPQLLVLFRRVEHLKNNHLDI
jgi:hypothetical protein